ncbi:hypothetical protein [Leptolyngbya sp. FACHB-261]|uniref:hypothetical protein n=1 Tax=Leptolyngbya sp. FACHB-261 TaxID=2692806 RepID=UPI001687F0C5|nr:hypothetical protein [Leptolyngbya sp. FACHB-261]MBD2099323.1 hypothetical protein [Leptolyngbya sp. FACHB-261]
MRLVNVVIPPQLRQLVLPNSQERYFGLHWKMERDELQVITAQGACTGSHRAYLAFHNHPRNFPALRDCNLGSSDAAAREMLLIDWQERRAYIAALAEGRTFLAQQNSRVPASSRSSNPAQSLAAALIQLDREVRGIDEISRWLDSQMHSLPHEDHHRAEVALLLRRLQGGAV